MKNFLTLCFLLLCANVISAQKYPIPQLNWDELSKTKPWEKTEDWSVVPVKVTPGYGNTMAPSDAIILFDGKDLSQWQKPTMTYGANLEETEAKSKNREYDNYPGTDPEWIIESGAFQVKPGGGDIETKKHFGDIQLHIEWLSPTDPEKEGQQYSNSGVFLMGLYEIQVLNSYDNDTYSNGQAGAIYKQSPPLVNASKPSGEWQMYDIIFMAPKFKNGKLESPARITAFHNGVLIQNNVELEGPTFYIGEAEYFVHKDKLPIILQDHGDKVRFRNVWVREL